MTCPNSPGPTSFKLVEQCAEPLGVVEPGAVDGGLFAGEPAGDGLAVDLAGPLVVRAVELWRVGLAAARGVAARGSPFQQGAGQREADLCQASGDVGVGALVGGGGFSHGAHPCVGAVELPSLP